MTTATDTDQSCPPPSMRTMILAESLALCLSLGRPVPMILNPRPQLRAKTLQNVTDEQLLGVYKELLIAASAELAAARRDRDIAIAEAERRYDCHGGPGTTEPACGGCISCLTRDLEAAQRAPGHPAPCPKRNGGLPCAVRTRAPMVCHYCGMGPGAATPVPVPGQGDT